MNRSTAILLLSAAALAASCEGAVTAKNQPPAYVLKADAYEAADADGSFTTNVLGVDTDNRQWHSLYSTDPKVPDVDYFRLNATAGQSYRIETLASNGDTLETLVELKNSSLVPQASNDAGPGNLSAISWWECPTTGPYLVLVSGKAQGYYGIGVDEFNGGKTATPYAQDFESTIPTPWSHWVTDNVVTHGGLQAIRTPAIGANETTEVRLLVDVAAPGKTLSFYWRVSSEAKNDVFRFTVDGQVVESISGSTLWTQVSKALTAGPHVVGWEYAKNGSLNQGYDAGWIDDLVIP